VLSAGESHVGLGYVETTDDDDDHVESCDSLFLT
jgi:hypothetical protein